MHISDWNSQIIVIALLIVFLLVVLHILFAEHHTVFSFTSYNSGLLAGTVEKKQIHTLSNINSNLLLKKRFNT